MRSAALSGIGQIDLTETPVPQPRRGEVLVRLRAVGICGSDVHYFVDGRIGDAVVQMPFVLGHEPAGEVAALGEGVNGLAVGQRVALEPSLPCGHCELCVTGRPNCCPQVRFLGSPPIPGVYEEYHLFSPHQCVPIPASITFEAAAALEPMAVGLHAVNIAHVKPGDRVAIMGCGPVGILTALAARLAGAAFIGMTDPIPARRAHAARLGADLVVDPTAEGAMQEIQTTAGQIDIAFEAAGVQQAIDDATLITRSGGTTVIIGIPAVDRISLWAHPLRRKELTILMSRRSSFELETCIRLMERGQIDPSVVITHRFTLEQLAEGMALVHHYGDGVLKAMIVMGEG
jgi:L-iditol 2-dehydrogenase